MRGTPASFAGGAATLLIGLLLPAAALAPGSDWWDRTRLAIERAEYRPAALSDGGLRAPNRAHGLRIDFHDEGVDIAPRTAAGPEGGAWSVAWRTTRWGRAGRFAPLSDAAPRVEGSRVVYTRGALDEWYENTPQGLEQGFAVSERLSGEGPLELVGRFGGGELEPRLSAAAGAVELVDKGGTARLRYAGLHVWDADGRTLPSRLALQGNEVALVVDDARARYPLTIDPILTAPSWTKESDVIGAQFGFSVATAGDVNGDGYSDVIVGAEDYDAGSGQVGAAFLYLGSPSGLPSTPAWTAMGSVGAEAFGHCVAPAGDVNGDDFADVLVNVLFYTNGEAQEGRALLYLGSSSGLAGSPAWSAEGNQGSAWFGASLGTAGDVNNDGFADVIVGAYGFDNGQIDEGIAYLYLGSAGGLASTPAWSFESNNPGANFGISVSTAGDVNADGLADVIVGAERYTNGQTNEGRAYVFHGVPSGLSSGPFWSIESNVASAGFGGSVATAGDTNGDGYADVVVGSPGYTNGLQTAEGRAFLYRGGPTGLSTSFTWAVEGQQFNANLGRCVAPAGDVNGDGYADVLVAIPNLNTVGSVDAGRIHLYYGSNVGLVTVVRWYVDGDQANEQLGFSVGTAGDVNGDGLSDVIAGAPGYSNGQFQEGRAALWYGATDMLNPYPDWGQESQQALAQFGNLVGSAGDVNGDGYSDLFVAAIQYDNGQFDEGRVSIHHGSASGPSLLENSFIEPNQQSAFLSYVTGAAGVGDINGDGYGDFVAGAPFYDAGQTEEGLVMVRYGSPSGLTGSGTSIEGNANNAHLGIAVAAAGDVNGDGFADFIVGAEQWTNGELQEGKAVVYQGNLAGFTPQWSAEGNQEFAWFGLAVAGAGDVNGDGYSDVVVGAQQFDNGETDEGRVFAYMGSDSGLADTPAWIKESNQAGANLGSAVASAGDVNGDGYSDVIVAAQTYNGGMGAEGRAEIYLGSPGGLAADPAWSFETNQINSGYGMAVASAGDVNGDGYSEVLVGSRNFSNGQTNEGRAYLFLGGPAGPDATPDWTAEGEQASANYAASVAGAGDVDGDGFSDVIVGAPLYDNGSPNEGYAFLYTGNLSRGLDKIARQARTDDTAPIALLGHSNSENAFRLKAQGRTPAGRADVRLVSEVKALGVPFDGTGLLSGPFTDTGPVSGGSKVALSQLASGLVFDSPYRWRSRIAGRSPYFPWSPWLSPPGNAPGETDLRMGDPAPRMVSIDDRFVVEGDAGTVDVTFTVTITPPPVFDVNVDYTTEDGTATAAGNDYEATSGMLHFVPGQATQPVTVTVNGDTEYEFDEFFRVRLIAAFGAIVSDSLGAGTIAVDSDPPNYAICRDFWVADRNVNTIKEQDGVLYVGGAFREIGPPTGGALAIDPSSAALVGVPRVEGEVHAVVPDGAGGWYVGGSFHEVGTAARDNLARFGPDHALMPWSPVTNGRVLAMAVSGGTVYVGGDFTIAGGQPRNNLAAFDAATGNVTSWNPSANAQVDAMAASGSTIYVGGIFTVVNSETRLHIAAIDAATGVPTSWAPDANLRVRAILPAGGVVYAGGEFTNIGGAGRFSIAALDATTGTATAWNPNATVRVLALALGPGVVYAGGDFGAIGGSPRNRIGAVDVETGQATSWNPEANSTVNALVVSGNTVYVGGTFTTTAGQARRNLAAIDATTGAALAWYPRANAEVRALATDGAAVFAGGLFSSAGGQERNGIAALDADTGELLPWYPGGSGTGTVNDLEVGADVVYAAGAFLTMGSVNRTCLAALDRTTGLPTAWNPNPNSSVSDLLVDGNLIYAAGSFSTIGGTSRPHLAVIDAATGFLGPWNPGTNHNVTTILKSGNTIYAGGLFSVAGGLPRNQIAALDATTGQATPWNPEAGDEVKTLLALGGRIYAGGAFTQISGTTRFGAAALDPVTGEVMPWNPDADGFVRTFVPGPGGRIFAGGSFFLIGGHGIPMLAALDTTGGAALPWVPQPNDEVRAIATRGNHVYVGGLFKTIGGLPRPSLACIQFAPGTVVDVPATPPAPGVALLRLSPNPSAGPSRIEFALPRDGRARIRVYDVRGRLVAEPLDEARPAGPGAITWDGTGTSGRVAAGIYFVRLETAAFTATQRLVRLR